MRTMSKAKPVSEALVHLVAALSGADVRTARKYLDDKPVKGAALRERLRAARLSAEETLAPNKPAKARRSR